MYANELDDAWVIFDAIGMYAKIVLHMLMNCINALTYAYTVMTIRCR